MNYHVERNPIDDQWKILDDEGFPFGSYATEEEAFDSLMDMEVYDRLEEICPLRSIDDMTLSELVQNCTVAFRIIDIEIENLENLVETTYISCNITLLWEFIYKVYLEGCNDS